LKQLAADPWSRVRELYEAGQVRAGRVTRVVEFGAFVELEPGVEALAHASTFASSGRSGEWSSQVAPGMTGAFEILSIDLEKKRIAVALLPEGWAQEAGDVREWTERHDPPAEGFGTLADKLRSAFKPREK
jgi:small subunit ribosomal protein S1